MCLGKGQIERRTTEHADLEGKGEICCSITSLNMHPPIGMKRSLKKN